MPVAGKADPGGRPAGKAKSVFRRIGSLGQPGVLKLTLLASVDDRELLLVNIISNLPTGSPGRRSSRWSWPPRTARAMPPWTTAHRQIFSARWHMGQRALLLLLFMASVPLVVLLLSVTPDRIGGPRSAF